MKTITRLQNILRQKPDAFDVRLRLSGLLFKSGSGADAISHYLHAKPLASTGHDYVLLGDTAYTLGVTTDAEAHYRKALRLMPDNLNALTGLARLYLYRGWLAQTMTVCQKIRTLDPEHKIVSACKIEIAKVLKPCGIDIEAFKTGKMDKERLYYPDIAFSTLLERVSDKKHRSYEPVANRYAILLYQLRLGGIQKKVCSLARHLNAKKYAVENLTLFCQSLTHRNEDAFLLPELEKNGIPVIEYYRDNNSNAVFSHPALSDYAEILVAMGDQGRKIAQLALALMDYKPEIVHGFGYQCVEFGIAAAIAGVPRMVLHSGNLRPITMASSDYWQDHCRWVTHACKALARLDHVMFTNNCRNASLDFIDWLDLPRGKIRTVYNGVDFDAFANADEHSVKNLRQSLKIPDKSPVIGSAFRFTEQKRPFLWLKVAERLARFRPEVHFIIAGNGPLFNEFKSMVGRSGIRNRIHLPGEVKEMPVWYKLMDVLLLTSSMEGTSNVAIEAQWYGVPVVSTQVGGMDETLVHGQSGWLVHPDKPELLARQLAWVLDHPDWRATAAGVGREYVKQQFNMENTVNQILGFNNKD